MSRPLRSIDEALREGPPMRAAPRRLHGRVMLEVQGSRPAATPARTADAGWLKVAACIALLAGALWSVEQWSGMPERAPSGSWVGEEPGAAGVEWVDTAPALIPTARTISVSLQRPLMNEAQSVLDDTRRAADFVVSCLPFTGR